MKLFLYVILNKFVPGVTFDDCSILFTVIGCASTVCSVSRHRLCYV